MSSITPDKWSAWLKQEAKQLGFLSCGISKADFLHDEAPKLEQFLKEGRHGTMKWLENHFDKRLDPRELVPGAKSVVSLLFNYHTPNKQPSDSPKISTYAYGEDYHFVVKHKMKDLVKRIQAEIGEVHGRVFVDSAPVMDKAWAAKSGLGWVGKNTNLISKQQGSFFFISELIIDLELTPDPPTTDHCGTCTKCIDACPTDALTAPYEIDAQRCISYLTIELKERIPAEFKGKMDNWVYGCDVCQDVCPWNRFSIMHSEEAFLPKSELKEFNHSDWKEITKDVFDQVFKKSAVKRTGFEGLRRNVDFLDQ